MSTLEPGQTLSHFRLLEKIGERAKLARLESEAKTIAALNHPHPRFAELMLSLAVA